MVGTKYETVSGYVVGHAYEPFRPDVDTDGRTLFEWSIHYLGDGVRVRVTETWATERIDTVHGSAIEYIDELNVEYIAPYQLGT